MPFSRTSCAARSTLGARLRDQALGDRLIVRALEAREHVGALGHEQLALDVEPVRRDAREPERAVGPGRVRIEVVAHTAAHVEVRADRARVEQLQLGFVDVAAIAYGALALAREHESVEVASDPALRVPAVAIALTAHLVLGEVDAHPRERRPAVLAPQLRARRVHRLARGERVGGAIRGRRRRRLLGGRSRRLFPLMVLVLRARGRGEPQHRPESGRESRAPHEAPAGRGRTDTTRNIPACMW
jgi:hypothetical protein